MEAATRISHQSRSVAYYLRPDHVPVMLWRHRALIRQLVVRAVAARYRGSVLGLLWSFILPLTMLAVWTFVFGVILKGQFEPDDPPTLSYFALTLFAGVVVYTLFVECVSAAPSVIVAHTNYVKRVVFPLEILPVVTLGSALVNLLCSLAMLLVGIGALEHRFPLHLLEFALVLVPLILLSLGLSWFLASVGVYLRDTAHVVTVVLQMLFYLTPIFYPLSRIPYESLRQAMRANPLTVIVENSRRTLMRGQPPEWLWLGIVTLAGLVALQLGYVWFMKTKRGFADVL